MTRASANILSTVRLIFIVALICCNQACGTKNNLLKGSWSNMTDTSAPIQRMLHTAVWTGDSMFMWGGYEPGALGYTIKNDGGFYDPKGDKWTIPTAKSPLAARAQHTAVWTGTEVIIWGGVDADRKGLSDGARYNPKTDTWTSVSNTNAPSGRMRHVAVWTGSKMIVWGGRNTDGDWLGSGAIYDPTADSWTTMTTTAAPIPNVTALDDATTFDPQTVLGGQKVPLPTVDEDDVRAKINSALNDSVQKAIGFYVTELVTPWSNAVWVDTVKRMYLIGGLSLGLGASFDPESNTWTAIGAPASLSWAPFSPPAVWTGKRIFSWDKGQGAIYDPEDSKWTLPADVGPLGSRYQHSMVLAGEQVIIWGGMSSSYQLRKGAFYYPLTDTWEETQTEKAPMGRYFHTSVWTGEAMIVWGGIPLSGGDTSLDRYLADPDAYQRDEGFRGAIYKLIKEDSEEKADAPPARKVKCPLGSKDGDSAFCPIGGMWP